MKAFKITYEFYNNQATKPGWDIGRAVVTASTEELAVEHFWSEVEARSVSLHSVYEMNTPQVVWAF